MERTLRPLRVSIGRNGRPGRGVPTTETDTPGGVSLRQKRTPREGCPYDRNGRPGRGVRKHLVPLRPFRSALAISMGYTLAKDMANTFSLVILTV